MIKQHLLQYNNILFSKDRSISQSYHSSLSKQDIIKKQKQNNNNNNNNNKTKQKTTIGTLFFHDRAFKVR